MTTVDQFLDKIIKLAEPAVESFLPKRDAKVLRSLSDIASGANFITENQSRLLMKILQENKEKFPIFQEELGEVINCPLWSRHFRKIEVVRKVDIATSTDGTPLVSINFTFSSQIRKILAENVKKLSGLLTVHNGKSYFADLTEKNIIVLVDMLKGHGFAFDERILDYYNTIKSWSKSDFESQFLLTNMVNSNFQNHITADLGLTTPIDNYIIKDRSVRYQYLTDIPAKTPENLTEKIAFRNSSRMWVDKKADSFEDIFSSLLNLKRLPVLLVYDATRAEECLENIQELSRILEKNGIFSDVGVYFRLDSSSVGQEFNKFIADKKYNCQLDNNTKVTVIANGKIPKFFLKTGWKPMSIVTFGKLLHNTKTTVYSNNCDLVITWSDTEPLVEMRNAWE